MSRARCQPTCIRERSPRASTCVPWSARMGSPSQTSPGRAALHVCHQKRPAMRITSRLLAHPGTRITVLSERHRWQLRPKSQPAREEHRDLHAARLLGLPGRGIEDRVGASWPRATAQHERPRRPNGSRRVGRARGLRERLTIGSRPIPCSTYRGALREHRQGAPPVAPPSNYGRFEVGSSPPQGELRRVPRPGRSECGGSGEAARSHRTRARHRSVRCRRRNLLPETPIPARAHGRATLDH